MDTQDVHTRLRVEGGGLEMISEIDDKRTKINPPSSSPCIKGLRYNLSMLTLGRLEKLAKSRFEIRELTNEDFEQWYTSDIRSMDMLVQSVNASSQIEGEGIAVEELPLILAAVTESTNRNIQDSELIDRHKALKSISLAALWALTSKSIEFITYDFVIELHKRMFESTRPAISGKIKTSEVKIEGAGYLIETLPSNKADEYLRDLCKRTDAILRDAAYHSTASMILTIAEFISDFLAIHPFLDGNGRTARLLSTYLLEKSGYHFSRFYPIDFIILETRYDYYEALYNAQKNWYMPDEDMTAWIDYYVNIVYLQFSRAYLNARNRFEKEKKS
ncbi:MAG: Fic family protein [Candidatus Kapabacteria bacterium]|nr:Fic family protein [Candidatus Kapabacteria bacterium]